METKSCELSIKKVSEGKVVATLARLGVIDRDGDVLKDGLLNGRQIVAIKPQHKWDHVNLGVAHVYEKSGTMEASMEFNMAIPSAKDWFEAIRFSHEKNHRQEYSFGFRTVDHERGKHDGKDVRFLKLIEMAEVSPVLIGASIGSQTISVKDTDRLLSGNDKAVGPMKERRSMDQEDPIVEPQPSEGKDADGSQDVVIPEAVDDWHAYAEDRRPPLPTMIKWLRLYRYHLPFLQDVRKRDKKEISPETISEFKTLVEEAIEVATKLNIAGLKAELLPSAEEQELLRQKYESRSQELYSQMNVEQERAHQLQQAKAAELERKARERQALIKKWNSDE